MMKHPKAVQNFVNFFENFSMDDPSSFDAVYSEDIFFRDPFHAVKGREALWTYFKNMMGRVAKCEFKIIDVTLNPEGDTATATVTWDMIFQHKALNGGKEIVVNGATHIKYNDKVFYHRDYFDSGQLIYKNIPVVKSIIRLIEKGM